MFWLGNKKIVFSYVLSGGYMLACAPIKDRSACTFVHSDQSLMGAQPVAKGPTFLHAEN